MTPSLLTLADIARLWGCSYRRARDTLVKQAGFPPMAPGSSRRNQRWRESDIQDFIDGRKFQEPV